MAAVRISREDLYRQVWETPMVKLATQYGISGNGLAKICDRLNVPYPSRGYWARKAAGQAVEAAILSEAPTNTPKEATIIPSAPRPTPANIDEVVVTKMKCTMSGFAESSKTGRLAKMHPIILAWKTENARALKQRGKSQFDFSPSVHPFTDADLRRHDLLNDLFRLLETQGGKITIGERQELLCVMDGEAVTFQLREKLRRLPRPSVLKEGYQKNSADHPWRGDLKPTGQLVFSIKTSLPGNLRQDWLETTEQPMEDLLPEIAAVLVTAGPLLVEQRRKRAEEERQRQVAEHQRYQENERRKLDRNRWRRFVELSQQHDEVRIARTFLAALKSSVSAESETVAAGRDLSEWIAWAEAWTRNGDPLSNGAKAVFEEVACVTSWTYRD